MSTDTNSSMWKGASVPLLAGAYSVAGLVLVRVVSGSSGLPDLETAALVGGTSAVAAAVSPMVTNPLVDRTSSLAPLADAGAAGALTWLALRSLSVSTSEASKFVPIAMASYLLANMVNKAMKTDNESADK